MTAVLLPALAATAVLLVLLVVAFTGGMVYMARLIEREADRQWIEQARGRG